MSPATIKAIRRYLRKLSRIMQYHPARLEG